jgi:hypothetical protein
MGTFFPSIWQNDRPNWILAMSRIAGSSVQPERVTAARTSSGAPHAGQLLAAASAA